MKKNLGVLMMVVMMICAVVFPSFGTTKVVSAKEYTYVKIFIDCKSIVPKAFVGSKIYIGTDVAVITADGDDARLSEICKQTFTVTEKNHGYFSAKLLILADESKNNETSYYISFVRGSDKRCSEYHFINPRLSDGLTYKFFDTQIDVQPLKAKTGKDNQLMILWNYNIKAPTGINPITQQVWPKNKKGVLQPIRMYILNGEKVSLSPAWKCPEWKDWPDIVDLEANKPNQKFNVRFKEIFK